MNVAEWQMRLKENFTVNGVGGNLSEVLDLERAYGQYFINAFHGQSVLIDSFQSFYIETIKIALKWIAENGWPKGCASYSSIFLYFVVLFRRFRACEIVLIKGYPLDGYALIRNLKDSTILLAGIAHNITTFTSSIFGYADTNTLTAEVWKKVKKDRKNEERRVLRRMIREDSGLPPEIIAELNKWEQLFHEEVHGSKLTFSIEMKEWIQGKAPPSIGPTPKEFPMVLYMNRATEIAWLLVRLLPYLQASENAFGAEWQRKHEILDDSFRYAQQGLSKLGKNIGDAFIKFVDEKFSFGKPFYYVEANGSG